MLWPKSSETVCGLAFARLRSCVPRAWSEEGVGTALSELIAKHQRNDAFQIGKGLWHAVTTRQSA